MDKFLYKCLGNGFSMKFGEAMYDSISRILSRAGVPKDIETSLSNNSVVAHIQTPEHVWHQKLERMIAQQANRTASRMVIQANQTAIEKQVYTICLDTGATHLLLWDDQDKFLTNKKPANANIIGAQKESTFSATSRGDMVMACLADDAACTRLTEDMRYTALLDSEVVTAPRSQLRKQLAGFPILFVNHKWNLDIRQWEEGSTEMWKTVVDKNGNDSRLSIPLRWDAVDMEWCFEYVPIHRNSILHKMLLSRIHEDLKASRGSRSKQVASFSTKLDHVKAFVMDLVNNDMAIQLKHVNLPDGFDNLMQQLPEDKRLEVVFARSAEEREILGVKQTLPSKQKRIMTEDEFHSHYGHMGCGKNCVLCALIRGSMRFIYTVVDKYIETRMGYFFDMDTLTVSHRASCGTKYYTCMRDRGSKTIKEFPLVFRSDFVDQFDVG